MNDFANFTSCDYKPDCTPPICNLSNFCEKTRDRCQFERKDELLGSWMFPTESGVIHQEPSAVGRGSLTLTQWKIEKQVEGLTLLRGAVVELIGPHAQAGIAVAAWCIFSGRHV